MLRLRSSVDNVRAEQFGSVLRDLDGVRRVVQQADRNSTSATVFVADVEPAAAAMLSFETRASNAVGVAISVTTIPASAYLGVAIGAGGIDEALGALVVLLINVSLLILSGSLTLMAQRWLPNRSGAPI
jgi:hypothetical protein